MAISPTLELERIESILSNANISERVSSAEQVARNTRYIEKRLSAAGYPLDTQVAGGEPSDVFRGYLLWTEYGHARTPRILLSVQHYSSEDVYGTEIERKPFADCSIDQRMKYGPLLAHLVEKIIQDAEFYATFEPKIRG